MSVIGCKICSENFYAKPSSIKNGHGIFCSNKCRYEDMRKGTMINCYLCKKESYKKKSKLKSSKSGKFFCSKNCQTRWRNQLYVGPKHANWINGMHAYRSVLKRNNIFAICKLCNTTDKSVLVTHHIDHNRKNNKVANLVWLCHNCHHLVHNQKGFHEKLMVAIV